MNKLVKFSKSFILKQEHKIYIFYVLLIAYLLHGTPLISDDFSWIGVAKASSLGDLLTPSNWFIVAPIEHYTLFICTRFFELHSIFLPNIIKIFYVAVSFYLISKFFSIFFNKMNSYIASFSFLFFYSHDSTTYWHVGLYMTLTIAFYLYAVYLAHKERLFSAFLMAVVASFTSYVSIPIAVFSFFFFILHKRTKEAFLITLPCLIFIVYYFFITHVKHSVVSRLPGSINLADILKAYLLQIFGFLDSIVGPSGWLKVFFAFFQISWPSIVIGLIAILILYRFLRVDNQIYGYDPKVLASFTMMMLSSFFLYAITGGYPQICFNLGNRVTIFGSLLVVYLIIAMPINKKIKNLFLIILIFVSLGISDHWKKWSIIEQKIFQSIKNNNELQSLPQGQVIYVSGYQYSKYGPLSHIEFFGFDDTTSSLFHLLSNGRLIARPINKMSRFEDGYLSDVKLNTKYKIDNSGIIVYDSEGDRVLGLKGDEINHYIAGLEKNYRHWLLILDNKRVNSFILELSPRLKYML